MIQRGGGAVGSSGMPDLLGLFRLQGRAIGPTLSDLHRRKFRAAAIRPDPGVFSEIRQSIWQPVNVPAAMQVDQSPSWMPPWPFNGEVGYLERQGYVQDPSLGQMQPPPNLPYSLRTPNPSTLPWMVSPGGTSS